MYKINVIKGDIRTDVSFYFKEVPECEEQLWKPVGKFLSEQDIDTATIYSIVGDDDKTADVMIQNMNGSKSFRLLRDDFNLKKSLYTKKLLRRVDIDLNKKSFYDFVPNNMGKITIDIGARYGLLGNTSVEEGNVLPVPFPSQLFWARYYTKLAEGYTDETEMIGEGRDYVAELFGKNELPKSDEDTCAVELYRLLVSTAKEFLDQSFDIDWLSEKPPYTSRQIESCWKLLKGLVESMDIDKTDKMVKEANSYIVKLLKIASPKLKTGQSLKHFAVAAGKDRDETIKDITIKAQEWENRILAMDAVVGKTATQQKEAISPFGNVEVRKANEDEFKHYQDLIRMREPGKVRMLKEVYILDPIDRRKKYEEALAKAADKSEEELFHGSQTQNMVSLIKSGGPTIHVSATNGRMFGNGSYWANSFDKSLGYTSYIGSRWAHGDSAEAFMLVGQVHTGKKYYPHTNYDQAERKTRDGGYDCCYALSHKTGLRKDEIITYDEEHSYVKAILRVGEVS